MRLAFERFFHRVVLTDTVNFFLVQFFYFFYFSYCFMSYFLVWGQLCRGKNIKIIKMTSFMSFSFIYLIFLINETHFCTSLICLLTFAYIHSYIYIYIYIYKNK